MITQYQRRLVNLCFFISLYIDLDDGASLKTLFEAEKELFGNNFAQVLMAHAACSLCANFDLAIETFDGCGIPVLIGHQVSGKSTLVNSESIRVHSH